MINGVRYSRLKPEKCKNCFFYKNKRKGCIFGGLDHCYFLLESPKKVKSRCTDCPYAKEKPCVLVPCYQELVADLNARRAKREVYGV